MIHIPSEIEFGSDFLDSDELKELGERVIRDKLPDLDDGELLIDYRWKRKGGSSGGRAIAGKCIRLSGLARHLSLGAHFCIWLAADICRVNRWDDKQLEALMFHELCHIEREEPDPEEEKPVIYRTVGHDVETFYAELREYGAWKGDLAVLVETVRQLPLPMEAALSPN